MNPNLKTIVNVGRRNREHSDTIVLVLALIECGVRDNIFFMHFDDNELTASLLTLIKVCKKSFYERLVVDDINTRFMDFLLKSGRLTESVSCDLEKVLTEIKKKGIKHYEFKRIDGVDKTNAEYSDIAGKSKKI